MAGRKGRQLSIVDKALVDHPIDCLPSGSGRGAGHQPASFNHGKPWAERGDVFHDVCREQHHAAFGKFGEQPVKPLTLFRIKAGGGLVDNQHPGIAGDCLREAEPLPHAAGVAADLPLGGRREVHPLKQLFGKSATPAAAADALELKQELKHRPAGEVGIEAEVLGQVAQPFPHECRVGHDVGAVEQHAAGGRLHEPSEDRHQRRLAGTIGAEQPKESLRDIEVDSLERRYRAGMNLDEAADRKALPGASRHRRIGDAGLREGWGV